MNERLNGGILLLIASFLLAVVQSCDLENDIIRPACFVLETDLEERWWHPLEDPSQPAVYFHANGLIETEGAADSVSFRIENCNKVRTINLSSGRSEIWEIKAITPEKLSMDFPARGLVSFSRKKI